MILDRYLKNIESPPSENSVLKPLVEGEKVLIQNQTGRFPLKWEKTGTVVEVLPFDQYIVKVSGSNRLTRRNRKFLRMYEPALTKDNLIVPEDNNTNVNEKEPESAWGARRIISPLPDSVSDRRGFKPNATDNARRIPPSDATENVQLLPNLDVNVDRRIVIPNASESNSRTVNIRPTVTPQESVGLRRSSRVNEGTTSRFKDYITGDDMEALEDDQ